MSDPLFFGITSLIMSLALGIPAAILAQRFDLIDVPGSAPHKQHVRPTPLAGGLLILLVLCLTFLLKPSYNREIIIILLGGLVIFFFGLLDDLKGLTAYPKLIGQLLASLLLISAGVQVRFITILFSELNLSLELAQGLNIFITLFWLVGITNAFNMIDSMDGIVAGIGVIASMFFLGAAVLSSQLTLALWSAILLGLSIGLYFWNGWASRFFLGDSGAQVIGFLLASFGILYNPLNRAPESSWIVPIMLLSAPIFDTSLVVLSRLRRGQRIGSGRRDHTYHRLIVMGLRPKIAVFAVHLATFIIGLLGFITLYLPSWFALTVFFSAIMVGMVVLFWLEQQTTLDETYASNS
ncbi:MAG: MraY family glycosyltransferase [Anaerolineales bacterium]